MTHCHFARILNHFVYATAVSAAVVKRNKQTKRAKRR